MTALLSDADVARPGAAPGDDLALLHAIDAKLGRILEVLERQQREPVRTLTRHDRQRLSRLLPVIAGAKGSDEFAARDVFDRDDDAWPALRLVTDGLTPKSLGRLFRRACGIAVDGYVVEATAEELGVMLWRVVQVVEPTGTAIPAVPRRDSGEVL